MAIYYARANGNVNATNVWSTTAGGTTSDLFPSFTSADTLMANGFTVALNVNTTVLEIRNDNANGATAGGTFSLSNGVILTSNVFGGPAACVSTAGTVSASIIGNITGGITNFITCVNHASNGTLTVVGNATGGNGTNASAIRTTGPLIFTGTITGSVTFGGSEGAVYVAGNATIIGNIVGGGSNGYGLGTGNGTVIVTGNATGGTVSTGFGINCTGGGTTTVVGTCTGATGPGANNSSTGTLIVTRAKGGPLASSAVGVSAGSTSSTNVEEIEYGDLGASPVSGPIRLVNKTSNVAIMYRFGTTKKTLTDASATVGLLPSTSDVRRNVVYNGGNNVGTMDVPGAASVASGVAVDNTTGTAILTTGNIADIWNYPVSGISVSNSIGERLKNCSTVATIGQQLAAALNNVQ